MVTSSVECVFEKLIKLHALTTSSGREFYCRTYNLQENVQEIQFQHFHASVCNNVPVILNLGS